MRGALTDFIESTRHAFADDLRSIVLYGSAAEGRLRTTSDVNLLLVLSRFDPDNAEKLREPLRIAHAAIRLRTMFLLDSEIEAATEAFAVKFGDIARRRRILYGADPFAGLKPSRTATVTRLNQTLLNLVLRLRETYVTRGLREEQLAIAIAEAAGPLRACAATLLELEGATAASPKEALEDIARTTLRQDKHDWTKLLSLTSAAREEGRLEPGVAGPAVLEIIELAASMQARAKALMR